MRRPSVDRRRRFRAPPHRHAHPCVACLPRLTGCGRLAWPTAPTSPTVHPLPSTAPRIQSRGHRPRTISHGRTHVVLPPTPGGRGSPPLRWVVAWVDGQRYYAAPTLHQPLSHGAKRRDSSPFRGAEGWVEVCGVYASVCRDADTYVSLLPVRGGVLDAPRSCYRRGGLDAPVRRDRWHPLLIRRAR